MTFTVYKVSFCLSVYRPEADSIPSSNSPQEGVFEPEVRLLCTHWSPCCLLYPPLHLQDTGSTSKIIDRKRLLSDSDEEKEDTPGPSKRVRINGGWSIVYV